MVALRVVTSRSLVEVYHSSSVPNSLLIPIRSYQGCALTDVLARGLLVDLILKAASTSQTLVLFYQIMWRYNSEDSQYHICRRETP
jgi:hypothetical protein